MSIIKLCGIALVSLLVCAVLRAFRSDMSGFASSAFIVVAACLSAALLVPVAEYAGTISDTVGIAEYMSPVFKALGIGIISGTTADICRDNGHAAIASGVETAAKITIISLSLPTVKAVISAAVSLIE